MVANLSGTVPSVLMCGGFGSRRRHENPSGSAANTYATPIEDCYKGQ